MPGDWKTIEKRRLTKEMAKEYSLLYSKVESYLRRNGLYSGTVGYNLLIQAVCFRKLLHLEEEQLLEMLEFSVLIPKNLDATKEDGEEGYNRPSMQWMRESLRAANIKEHPFEFIEKMASIIN